MVKVSELISKVVISLYDGGEQGVIENVLLDNTTKKAKYFVLFNLDSDVTYILPTDKIYAIGKDAVNIKNASCLCIKESKDCEVTGLVNPINSSVYSTSGNLIGIVSDVILNEKFSVVSFVVNNKEIPISDLAVFGDSLSIYNDPNHKVNVKAFYERKKITTQTDSRIVNILKEPPLMLATPQSIPPTTISTLIPNRAITNYTFLINRKVQKNILGMNGGLLIKQNSRINTGTINLARQNGKLKELTKYSI